MEWQPIETAPKDGRIVQLYGRGWDGEPVVTVGGWIDATEDEPGLAEDAGWWSVDLVDNKPLMWQPLADLPSPPEAP